MPTAPVTPQAGEHAPQSVREKEREIILMSAKQGYIGMLQYLEDAAESHAAFAERLTLQQGAALVMAAKEGHKQVVTYILEYVRSHTPWLLPRLLEAGDSTDDSKRYAAFIVAARHSSLSLLEYLLRYVAEHAPNQFAAAKEAALSVGKPEVELLVGRIIADRSLQQSSREFGLWAWRERVRARRRMAEQQPQLMQALGERAMQAGIQRAAANPSQGPIRRRRYFQSQS